MAYEQEEPGYWATSRGGRNFTLDGQVFTEQASCCRNPPAPGQKVLVASTLGGKRGMVILSHSGEGVRKRLSSWPFTLPYTALSQLWTQTWSATTKSGLALSTADPTHWPGENKVSFETETGGGAGGFGPVPNGLLIANDGSTNGRVWLSHLIGTSGTAAKLRVEILDPSDWHSVDSLEIELSDSQDQAGNNPASGSMRPDSLAFWTLVPTFNLTICTVLPRASKERRSDTSGDTANLWVVREDSSALAAYPSTVTVGTGKGLCQFAVSSPDTRDSGVQLWAARLALDHDTIYGYKLDLSDIGTAIAWVDEWSTNWQTSLESLLGSGMWAYGGGSGNRNGGMDISPPEFILATVPYWVIPVSGRRTSTSPNTDAFLTQMRVRQDTGAVSKVDIYNKLSWTLSDCINPTDALAAHAAAFLAANPTYEPSESTVEESDTCAGDGITYDYTRTVQTIWRGVVDSEYSLEVTLIGGSLFTLYLAQGREPSDPVAVESPTVLLGGGGPNLNSRDERAFWTPVAGSAGGRFVTTASNRTYTAGLISVPVKVPGNLEEFGPNNSYTQFGACWFATHTYTKVAGIVPDQRHARELVLFGLRSDGTTVDSLIPFARHSGVYLGADGFADLFTTTTPIPIPENVYGVMAFEDIDCVAWLCDKRSGPNADPIPCVVVTDLNLTQVRHTIPSSDLVPVDTFESDQVYDGATWAYAGEARYRYHNQDPEMKGWVRSYTDIEGAHTQHVLAIGLQYYDRVQPSAGTTGTTYSRTILIDVTPETHTVLQTNTATSSITWPSLFFSNVAGPQAVRSMAAGSDFACFARDDSGEFAIYEIR